ncbi:MAG: hypothetical protein K2N56_03845 [Oscillospiraceae bacterium]|nr:hypothetical protein [Oscillospiraceae bacterium]
MENRSANQLRDGEYKAEIILSGGTGRTTIQSPANVYIENGVITAEIIWSSPSYDLMIVGGKEYKPISNDGKSVFLVEIPSADTPLDIKAETVAMSAPHMIDYTITVSGSEFRENTSPETSGNSSMTSEEMMSMLESMVATPNSSTGSVVAGISIEVSGQGSGGIPTLAVIGISAALGAALAYAAVTIGKKNKK